MRYKKGDELKRVSDGVMFYVYDICYYKGDIELDFYVLMPVDDIDTDQSIFTEEQVKNGFVYVL